MPRALTMRRASYPVGASGAVNFRTSRLLKQKAAGEVISNRSMSAGNSGAPGRI
jgi:hypothetical protein